MSVQELLSSMEAAYDTKLPARYRKFLESGEHAKYERLEFSGYISGPYDLDFVDPLLADVVELGMNVGIYDIDDVPWAEDYSDFVPIASLSHPDVEEPKMFLVMNVTKAGNPVLLFENEGWKLYPVADSFDAFLKAMPNAENDISKSFRPGGDGDE